MKPLLTEFFKYFCLIALVTVWIGLNGCTYVSYQTQDGAKVRVADLHPVGGDVDLQITKPDGTKLKATRGQGSSEGIVDTITSAVTPSPVDSTSEP